ncbi:MAG: DNA-binding protein [Microcoleus sp. PH2017_10_PVI_O_A]|uniref:helix-hairpin-helix domain-containing protein n=1 Tax=unclassified Microcoleus TaxID=2642155 RepID=UPI001D34A144|nr:MULTISPECIES: DNA-binding protein [unclassified Microcoleus]TAE78500.1 MAG: DNA-binding protein [Oscillatoriales cyanobacterium]MCC3408207.1 DNA-binding protein [Microcoleus sp. PH2017_10_PVI_O_A]MCC3462897.1 DNA-binding protein [Microcoleus sp. PH2017_11_PCY_U_A]MCC3480752.1 DNA-binding protein [Microcoleus sp. PH2017_12_PCY_D_A]MCC3530678.1 DNA-binding protein [Microcoleus sp. PH2017_21_RUC_O_A]
MQLQRQFSGQLIAIDTNSAIASGGEGRIYPIAKDSSLVAKIYHKPTDEDGDKLTVMFSMPPDAPIAEPGHASIAWPLDLLHTVGGREKIVGFVMPRVNKVLPVHTFYTPKTRREQKPLFNYLYLHRTARNLASAVNALHVRGYVIGDVNESNILVTDTALVTLVDTDSFQVRDPYTGYVYRCPVGKPEFTPPELQGQTFRDIDRAPEHDLFGLAVLIFQLLMEGTHPFSGVYLGTGEPPSLEARIRSGHFPSGTKRIPYRPMPAAPPFEMLHPRLRQMFLRCFEEGHSNPSVRPDAKTWVNAIREAEDSLITCSKNSQHKYGNHLSRCPWCDRAKLLKGRDPFPSRGAVSNGLHLQPAKTKRKKPQPPPVVRETAVRRQQPSTGLPRQLGNYQLPMLPIPSRSRAPAPPVPLSKFERIVQDAAWGGVWGTLCLAAVAGIFSAIAEGGGAILGAIFVGSIWGSFFGMMWGIFTLSPNQIWRKWGGVLLGSLWGAFFLAAISGVVFGAISDNRAIGQGILSGAGVGTFWGGIWAAFSPPLARPVGRVWGRRGAFLGAVWGAFMGTWAGVLLGAGLVVWQQYNGLMRPAIEFGGLLVGVAIVAAGVGAIGGLVSGSLLGFCGFAPKLPVSFQPSGIRGAALGSIWGSFLGNAAGAVLGAGVCAVFPALGGGVSVQLAPVVGAIVGAGLGAIWGIISGAVWGALGKW